MLMVCFCFQNIIERFPASLIKEPTAFTSNGPMEMYNNILVFIVGGGSGSRSEMHIFQVSIGFLCVFFSFFQHQYIYIYICIWHFYQIARSNNRRK